MDQTSCTRTNWLFGKTAQAPATDLVKFGGTGHTQASRARGGRLSVSASCSLVIQKVSASDVGTYYCQQFNSLNQKETTNTAALALANFTEEKDEEEVTLGCSVISNDPCKYTISWLLNGQNIDKEDIDFETEKSDCSAKVTFQTSRLVYEAGSYTSLKCEVAETGTRRKQLFAFRPQTPVSGVWWLYIIVGAGFAAGLAAVLFAVWLFIKRKKNKGNKTQVGENQGLNPHSTASQPAIETSQDTDELDDTIPYATIILPKTNNQFQRSDAAVTYSALKVGASPD
ncbi:uncharacterized protein LOC105918564 [Fundulus heteroclitus]|uniref:uncharacterized protein LOC105918564 n=1 Tax=Fundulus heteroclitus TaxID=8078 RepID=UPI00165B464A|nr:uncharacterized protein LOC105918564 [Fundulus heteroclitus]